MPAWAQQPFQKQITRNQALIGKLLEDNTLVRVLRGASSQDVVYDTKHEAQSHNLNTSGHVRQFGNVIGRIELSKAGSRAAAAGSKPSNWFPQAPPKDHLTRPASATSGVAFERQITRRQDVNGKLLEDNAMTRFLFGQMGNGPEYYEKAMDSLMKPLNVSHRPKVGVGQHNFTRQAGRLPLSRAGSRSAAEGSQPSYWEPGMAYKPEGKNLGKAPSFERNIGRVDLHLSGMRGAPPGPSLAADFAGGSQSRPQSAIAMLRSAADNVRPDPPPRPLRSCLVPRVPLAAKRHPVPLTTTRHASHPSRLPRAPQVPPSFGSKRAAHSERPIAQIAPKHIYTLGWDKQSTRDQWTSQPLRIQG